MAEEKKEIEDILAEPDKEDLDIEEAVSEPEEPEEEAPEIEPEGAVEEEAKAVSSDSEKKEKTSSKKPERKEKPPEPKKKEEKDILEKAVEKPESVSAEESILEKPIKVKKKRWKIVLIVLLTVLVTAAAVLGVVYVLTTRNKNKTEDTKTEDTKTEEPAEKPATDNSVYVNAAEGLNLRKEPNTKAEILAIIPFGTKLVPLETSGEWIKVEYNGKTGWVNTQYTSKKNPLSYENTDYGFSFTFPSTWAGYKFIPKNSSEATAVFYVALPTTDKSWTDPSGTAGYGSLFAVDVYTKAQWTAVQAEEGVGKPAKLGEKGNYVFAWSSGQATPSDLTERFGEIKSIIETFKVI